MPTITNLSQLDLSRNYTYADYLTWRLDEWVELIKGKVQRMSPAPRRVHQAISARLASVIETHLFEKPCEVYSAPFDVRLTTAAPNDDSSLETVVQPDICVVCDSQKLDEFGCVGAPDWIIEIVSPSTAAHDTRTKFDLYEEAGVREYWIAFPGEKTITAYVLEEDRYQLRGSYYEPGPMPAHTLPELALTWERIFAGI